MLRTPQGRFRIVAVAEALSWAGLLVGMLFKHALNGDEIGVQVFGPIHGVVFIVYIAVALAAWQHLRWSAGTGVVALLAAFPPLATWPFERWALRTGRLEEPGGSEAPAAAA
jgi:integral membrane protein